ncbi:MAG: hypothetical protein J5767_12165 [Paludibacteraceae bacterium]|nr:hypothetical protein [Paludibacteraceae bacterium]
MISRFSQLSLAFTTVTPLLFSIAVVIIILYPSGYMCGWLDLFCQRVPPNSGYWWAVTLFILLFMYSWIWTIWFLNRQNRRKRETRTIMLSSIQYQTMGNILPVVAMLPPWLTLLLKDEVMLVMTMTAILSLVITCVMSRQGYSSLIFLLCGYKRYEGQDKNGMKIQLLSRRTWRNSRDVRTVILLSDYFSLVI